MGKDLFILFIIICIKAKFKQVGLKLLRTNVLIIKYFSKFFLAVMKIKRDLKKIILRLKYTKLIIRKILPF